MSLHTDHESPDDVLRIYKREELLRIGASSSRSSNIELPPWTDEALRKNPDCGHIIFPSTSQARLDQQADPTPPWDKEIMDELKMSSKTLEEEIVLLCERLGVSEERKSLLESLSKEIETSLQSEFPECRVFPYGSFSSGFAFENCDLDVYASLDFSIFDESSDKPSDTWTAREKTRAVGQILRRNERFRSATAITNAKIPIVKIKDRRTGIKCDVNTSSVKGVKNSEFLNFCKNYDIRVDQLVKVVKFFSIKHGAISSGLGSHFNSYTVVIMVIFFLQSKDILPSVASLQESVPEDIFENSNFAFNKEKKTSSDLINYQNISELLTEFFKFYASFSFSSEVISPLLGRSVRKESFQSGEGLPAALAGCQLKTEKHLVIQDPFELSKNLGQNVSYSRLAHLISLFEFAVSVLKQSQCDGPAQLWRIFEEPTPDLESTTRNIYLECEDEINQNMNK